MENDRGEVVDLYVPRKCSATGRLIKATDHASVQISVAKLDESGRQVPGENHMYEDLKHSLYNRSDTNNGKSYALSGFVRAMGESDDAFNRITQKDGLLKSVWSPNR
ncbi:hypothetical protein GQX73_g5265 [Xylaria multiplex]|uniref:40S ribosomal protein S21 n=1 Tax=Xylaria multiplex TaxID=323545 RepID=A0A7C8N4U3_9PEZI|nr:hypothetical protein GQX73_g5265 [Xylaria multiplex]